MNDTNDDWKPVHSDPKIDATIRRNTKEFIKKMKVKLRALLKPENPNA